MSSLPLFDFLVDIPHPCPSVRSSSSPRIIKASSSLKESETVCKELTEVNSMGHIARCAFPEFSDKVHAATNNTPTNSCGLNKYDIYLKSFQTYEHSFVLKSSLGSVFVYARTYLPAHKDANGRADVGRRSKRSLLLFTRRKDNQVFAVSVLKTIDAIIMQKTSTKTSYTSSIQFFLNSLLKNNQESTNISIQGLEFGESRPFLSYDQCQFIINQSSMQPSNHNFEGLPVIPILRCLGPHKTVRLLSALMCERRIAFLSTSPTRLHVCVAAAYNMLQCGMLTWPHIVIPVLPPHQFPALGSKSPYIVGIITKAARDCRIDKIPGAEHVILFDLDHDIQGVMGFLGSNNHIDQGIPDLLRGNMMDATQNAISIGQVLHQDLVEIHKNDKFKYTSNLAATVQNIYKKGGMAAKNVAGKIKRFAYARRGNSTPSDTEEESEETQPPSNTTAVNDDGYVIMKNELTEDDLKSVFVSFFLNLFGNGQWYLSNSNGSLVPNPQRFLEERSKRGDGKGSAMYPLIFTFVKTTLFANFIQARIAERARPLRLTADSPFFLYCVDYLTKHQISYSTYDVRRTVEQISQNRPQRQQILRNDVVRNITLSITSSRPYDGNISTDISKLTQACRIVTTKLVDVMDIIWMRIRNCRSQWKPALHALFLLRNLILHGPITAIAEAITRLDKIHTLKKFQNTNRSNSAQIQNAAKSVHDLLVDQTKLFALRRAYVARRRIVSDPKLSVPLKKEIGLKNAPSFMQLHIFLRPKVTPITSVAEKDLLHFADSTPKKKTTGYSDDLLSFDFQSPTPSTHTESTPTQNLEPLPAATTPIQTEPPVVTQTDPFDIFANSSAQTQPPTHTKKTQNHVANNLANTPTQTDAPVVPQTSDPFDIFADKSAQTNNPFENPKTNSNPFDSSVTSMKTPNAFNMEPLRQATSNVKEPQSYDNPFTAPAVTQHYPSSTSPVKPTNMNAQVGQYGHPNPMGGPTYSHPQNTHLSHPQQPSFNYNTQPSSHIAPSPTKNQHGQSNYYYSYPNAYPQKQTSQSTHPSNNDNHRSNFRSFQP